MKPILFLLSCVISAAKAGHYLFWAGTSCKSDHIGMMNIAEELAKRGHEATFVGCHSTMTKNVEGITEIINLDREKFKLNIFNPKVWKYASMESLELVLKLSIEDNRNLLRHPQVEELLRTKHVDVLFTYPEFANEVSYLLAKKKNASLVMFTRFMHSSDFVNWANGDPFNPSYMMNWIINPYEQPPMIFQPGSNQRMTFLGRLKNFIITLYNLYLRYNIHLPKIHRMLAEVFPDEPIPHIDDMIKATALTINGGNPFLIDGARPVMPKTLLAGMMNCKPQNLEPLPVDLKNWVEDAEHGVILVSFGQVLKPLIIPDFEVKIKLFLSVFGRLKQRIIWKWDTSMPDAPNNTLISPWVPQQSLLAHENVKLFITHGGVSSFQEAICHKTPIVGIPFFGDQFLNIDEATRKHIGVHVNFKTMTEKSLATSINEVLDNTSYKAAIIELSDLVMDQPQHPMDRVVWWMEYLLRHPHNPGMVSPTQDLWWFQYFLLDVIAVILLGVVIVLVLLFLLLWGLCKGCVYCHRRFVELFHFI